MPSDATTLRLTLTQGTLRYSLQGRSLNGGDVVELCCAGGWLAGRFEWDAASEGSPTFCFSLELEGGRVAPQTLLIPEGARLRWP